MDKIITFIIAVTYYYSYKTTSCKHLTQGQPNCMCITKNVRTQNHLNANNFNKFTCQMYSSKIQFLRPPVGITGGPLIDLTWSTFKLSFTGRLWFQQTQKKTLENIGTVYALVLENTSSSLDLRSTFWMAYFLWSLGFDLLLFLKKS